MYGSWRTTFTYTWTGGEQIHIHNTCSGISREPAFKRIERAVILFRILIEITVLRLRVECHIAVSSGGEGRVSRCLWAL